MLYASVIVDISLAKLDKCFSYIIPEELRDRALPGASVVVPFGNRKLKGYIVAVTDQVDIDPSRLKPILELQQEALSSQGQLIALAEWMRQNYGATMNQALRTVLPSAKRQAPKMRKVVHAGAEAEKLSDALALLLSRARHSLGKERLLRELLHQPDIPWDELTQRLSIPSSDIRDLESMKPVRTILALVDTARAHGMESEAYRSGKAAFIRDYGYKGTFRWNDWEFGARFSYYDILPQDASSQGSYTDQSFIRAQRQRAFETHLHAQYSRILGYWLQLKASMGVNLYRGPDGRPIWPWTCRRAENSTCATGSNGRTSSSWASPPLACPTNSGWRPIVRAPRNTATISPSPITPIS